MVRPRIKRVFRKIRNYVLPGYVPRKMRKRGGPLSVNFERDYEGIRHSNNPVLREIREEIDSISRTLARMKEVNRGHYASRAMNHEYDRFHKVMNRWGDAIAPHVHQAAMKDAFVGINVLVKPENAVLRRRVHEVMVTFMGARHSEEHDLATALMKCLAPEAAERFARNYASYYNVLWSKLSGHDISKPF